MEKAKPKSLNKIEVSKLKVNKTPLRDDYMDACILKSGLQSEVNFLKETNNSELAAIKGNKSAFARVKKRFGLKVKTREEAMEHLNGLIKKLQSRVKDSNRRKQSKLATK